jgi:hypothetical protein
MRTMKPKSVAFVLERTHGSAHQYGIERILLKHFYKGSNRSNSRPFLPVHAVVRLELNR